MSWGSINVAGRSGMAAVRSRIADPATAKLQRYKVVLADPQDGSNATGVNGPHNSLAPCSGAAYVFRRSGTSWPFFRSPRTLLFDCSPASPNDGATTAGGSF